MSDLTQFQRDWPLLAGGQTQPLTRGTNNLMYRIDTGAGSYVLRIAGSQVSSRRLEFEYDVLSKLCALGLPFALPAPLLTARDEPYARVPSAEGGEALATLTSLIPGAHPQRDDLAQVEAAGAALGQLDNALAGVSLARPQDALDWRSTGDLGHCHPSVPDPREAITTLPLAADARNRLAEDYDALLEQSTPLYASLPRRLSHEDYDTSNVLLLGARVTGVLDFEFCALDLRPMDLVVALTWWPVERFGSGDEWPIIAALLRGYARWRSLDAAEIAAIPTLFRLRAYTSLIHRLGRQRQGLSPMEHVVARAWAALEREAWLQQNSERLIQEVDEALRK
ncbi:MAG TPA: phosphotransferase [Ktedonobacterales bacterium]